MFHWFSPNGCAPSVWGNHAWYSLSELARRGASVCLVKDLCSLLVCAACRESIAQFQLLVPLTDLNSVSEWVQLAHDFVNAKENKPRYVLEPQTALSDEDFSFHLCMTVCFFMNHHDQHDNVKDSVHFTRLARFCRDLSQFLQTRTCWLVPGLMKGCPVELLECHNRQFPASAVSWTLVQWVIESSRASSR